MAACALRSATYSCWMTIVVAGCPAGVQVAPDECVERGSPAPAPHAASSHPGMFCDSARYAKGTPHRGEVGTTSTYHEDPLGFQVGEDVAGGVVGAVVGQFEAVLAGMDSQLVVERDIREWAVRVFPSASAGLGYDLALRVEAGSRVKDHRAGMASTAWWWL